MKSWKKRRELDVSRAQSTIPIRKQGTLDWRLGEKLIGKWETKTGGREAAARDIKVKGAWRGERGVQTSYKKKHAISTSQSEKDGQCPSSIVKPEKCFELASNGGVPN